MRNVTIFYTKRAYGGLLWLFITYMYVALIRCSEPTRSCRSDWTSPRRCYLHTL